MQTIKQGVIKIVTNLPDDVDYDEVMAEIYFKQKVDKSLSQISEGKVISHQKAKQKISKWTRRKE